MRDYFRVSPRNGESCRWISTAPDDDEQLPRRRLDPVLERPTAEGKFLYVRSRKLWVRGVTYGTFRPDEQGNGYKRPADVERDFALMRANGINAVRVYTVPPRWLLDLAAARCLRVMVGLPWEQHIAFLETEAQAEAILQRVRNGVRSCAGHPALLCYAVGNEIPASIVRWYGPRRIERFIRRLCDIVRDTDPGSLVTYVNYPTTEYLHLPFVDLFSFNVYLESKERLSAYLKRLHNVAGSRPVLMAEIGLDSRSNGEAKQAEVLDWQVRATFEAGCCGGFVFAWTDEWHRGGHDIEDWAFGLTTRDRQPKPALMAVQRAYALGLAGLVDEWPRMSVVVCSYNGSRTIRDTLEGLLRLDYPDYEVIVADDGSTDATADIAREFPVRLIQTPNRGLSNARNLGLACATGEFVAYTDDDARPDPDWLTYLALAFRNSRHVGIGGPNITPRTDGLIAQCIGNAPGGPVHILLTDELAEHIPGCNMAFRKSALEAIGGFDPRFRAAGDDVDVCWRLQERGWTLGFCPGALVWHHRRDSVGDYWRQQIGYGRAEALLEQKWPERYNGVGHVAWGGRLYGAGIALPLPVFRGRIYHGTWGTALFQSVYGPTTGLLRSLPLMPEWYIATGIFGVLSLLSLQWTTLAFAPPLLAIVVAVSVTQAVASAFASRPHTPPNSADGWLKPVALTSLLHLMQPAARLYGRIRGGLTLWRGRRVDRLTLPRPRSVAVWTERWRAPEEWLAEVEKALRRERASFGRGGGFDRWDVFVRGGLFGRARLLLGVEEHGAGRQYVRFRLWPKLSSMALALLGMFSILLIGAMLTSERLISLTLGCLLVLLGARCFKECSMAETVLLRALPAAPVATPVIVSPWLRFRKVASLRRLLRQWDGRHPDSWRPTSADVPAAVKQDGNF